MNIKDPTGKHLSAERRPSIDRRFVRRGEVTQLLIGHVFKFSCNAIPKSYCLVYLGNSATVHLGLVSLQIINNYNTMFSILRGQFAMLRPPKTRYRDRSCIVGRLTSH